MTNAEHTRIADALEAIVEQMRLQREELQKLRRTIYNAGNRIAPEPLAHLGTVREAGNG